jgi:hypothetical protein
VQDGNDNISRLFPDGNGKVLCHTKANPVARIGPATNKLAGSLKAARFAAFLLGDGTQLWASRG